MMMTMNINLFSYGLLVSCLLLNACSQRQEAAITRPEAVESDNNGGSAPPAQPLIWSREEISAPVDGEEEHSPQAVENEALQHSTMVKKKAQKAQDVDWLSTEPTAADTAQFVPLPHQVRFQPLIKQISAETGLDVQLLHAMIEVESGYRPEAISPKGATGLMQVMPKTGKRFGAHDLKDPEHNLRAGASYMKWLMAYFNNDLTLALAAYNAGEGSVVRYGRKIPPYPETQQYVKKVLARYQQRGMQIHSNSTAKTALQAEAKPAANSLHQPEAATGRTLAHNLLALLFSAPAGKQAAPASPHSPPMDSITE
jgi:hypothetical protein